MTDSGLDVDQLVDRAMESTGLDDFGEPTWREGLEHLVPALQEEARLNELGEQIAIGGIIELLSNRLAITDWRARHPEVASADVVPPIVIVGQARTGTTILFDLLAQDLATRAPVTWEIDRPVPPPETATFDTDPRIDEVDAVLSGVDLLMPGFRSMHPMGARLAQECVSITNSDFRSVIFPTQYRVPSYGKWVMYEADMKPAYRWHRQFLQHLQSRHPAGDQLAARWLVKSPAHIWCLDALLGEYPDALLVQTHRDPLRIIASVSSLMVTLRGMTCDAPNLAEVANEWAEYIVEGLDRSVAARLDGTVAADRVVDVQFEAFMADPFAVIGQIYDALGLQLTAESEGRMRSFLADHGQDEHGKHAYSFAETGLDLAEWRERTRRYQEHFGVPTDAKFRERREDLAMDDALATWTASKLAAAIRAREISSRDLLELYIDRIERLNPPVNAVITLDLERARAEARRADDDADHGAWRGPLHGLPITIKDAIEVAGIRSTGGAVELKDHVPTADAPSVARLKDAGAIVFGKTNVPRWSGDLQTHNELFGTTNNPWNLERIPGGSSGGPAAAVAAGFTSFELGTDIGGSVRIPSHCCGVFGLKPSFGVVSQRGYLDHVGGGTTEADINVFGPIARSADDLALLMDVLAAPEADRSLAWRLDLPAPRQSELADFRVGVWFDEPGMPMDHDQLALLRNAASSLSDAGAKVEEAHPAVNFAEQIDLFNHMIVAAISPSLDEDFADVSSGSHLTWLRKDEQRARLRSAWATWFETYDALLCPVLPVPAFPHDQDGDFLTRTVAVNDVEHPYLLLTNWTGLIGVVGLPSAVAPIGRTPAGIPVGVQVVTPYLRDREAVLLAGLLADVSGGGYAVPPGF